MIALVLGLLLGSAVAGMTYSMSASLKYFTRSRSICPNCEVRLKWYSLVPVISFIAQNGKCAECGNIISFRYILIEIAQSLLFVWIYSIYGFSSYGIVMMLLSTSLLIMTVIDLEHYHVHDIMLLINLCLCLTLVYLSDRNILQSIMNGILCGGLILLISMAISLVVKKKVIGIGDIILITQLSFIIKNIEEIVVVMMLLGLSGTIFILLWTRATGSYRCPFVLPIAMSFLYGATDNISNLSSMMRDV